MAVEQLKTPATSPPDDQAKEQRQAVGRLFDEESRVWGEQYDQPVTTLSQLDVTERLAVATRMVRATGLHPSAHPVILDIGCGTGEGTSKLYSGGMTVIATDLSAGMVSTAVRRYPFLRGSVADAAALPFPDGHFDVVQALGVLEYIAPYEKALRNLRRVLKPGGTLVFSIPNRNSLFRRLNRAERFITGPLRRMRRSRSPGQFDFRHRQWTLPEAVTLLQKCGLALVDVHFLTYGFLLPAAENWRANLALCRLLNARCDGKGLLSRSLACTAVLRAKAV